MPPRIRPSRRAHFPVSLFATANPLHQEIFLTVPRAGHLIGGDDHHIRRDHFPGHELILCLAGRGYVRIAGREHPVARGDLLWVDCRRPHQHGPLADDPWEVVWVRAEGPRLTRTADVLGVEQAPVFPGFDVTTIEPIFRTVFRLIEHGGASAPALIHAEVTRLVALAFAARQGQEGMPAAPNIPAALQPAMKHLALFFFERQRVDDLAHRCGMSASHFTRTFRSAFGTSPIDWLRRRRITEAQRRLVESDDAIKRIAEQVGYGDRFFFSRDFRKLTGQSPRQFRERERGAVH
ncbi:MAG: AraC family transcriptional regulator [Planctomycetes bacterium]|nr:AraC family transcriptional regulator [Planctomycetota bacterium]